MLSSNALRNIHLYTGLRMVTVLHLARSTTWMKKMAHSLSIELVFDIFFNIYFVYILLSILICRPIELNSCKSRLCNALLVTRMTLAHQLSMSLPLRGLPVVIHCSVLHKFDVQPPSVQAFCLASPVTWNSLTDSLCDPSLSIDSYQPPALKTFLFLN